MKRTRLTGLAALALLTLGLIHDVIAADSGTAQLNVSGTAPAVCTMSSPTAVNSGNAAVQGANITISSLIKPEDATIQAWQATMNYPAVMCNYAAFISIRSQNGGMKLVGSAPQPVSGPFLTQVHYTVTAKWGPLNAIVLDTAVAGTDPVSTQAPGPVQGDVLVTVQGPASTRPLARGDYQDVVFVSVGPVI